MELNEQTLEQILTRQEEKFERALEAGLRETRQYIDTGLRETRQELKEYAAAGLQETRHYMGILTEGLRSDIQLVAEAVSGLQEQLTALRDLVAKNTEDIEIIKTDIEVMKSELSIIRRDLKEKAGRDELAVLEARVAMLERGARGRPQ